MIYGKSGKGRGERNMSKAFFIWTMRRTGGTSLTALLTDISEFQGVQHEPFNSDRKLGHFITMFRQGEEKDIISNKLDELFQSTPLIKHCYELFGKEFNELIVDATSKQEYKHLFLKREDEISRIISLFLAQQTSVWGPEQKKQRYDDIISGSFKLKPFDIDKMVEHTKWCHNITRFIKDKLTENQKEFKVISFEEFYVGDRETRLSNLYNLFDYLEFDVDVREKYKDKIEEKLFKSSQNSKSILEYVPNYKEALLALENVLSKE